MVIITEKIVSNGILFPNRIVCTFTQLGKHIEGWVAQELLESHVVNEYLSLTNFNGAYECNDGEDPLRIIASMDE
ncbi:MAG: hypothetical protein HRU20_30965 [Pseudomonadales bacterium]|nr:hypothetical protein [Pseudomonadales bacterium]